jgi:hypothetical protein
MRPMPSSSTRRLSDAPIPTTGRRRSTPVSPALLRHEDIAAAAEKKIR